MSDLASIELKPNPFLQPDAPPVNAPTAQPKFLADSAETFFGAKPQHLADSPETLFGPRPDPGIMARVGGFLSSHLLPDPASLLGGEAPKLPKPGDPHRSVISPIIDAAVRGFGGERLGLSPETEKWMRGAGIFNDWETADASLWRTLNEAAVRSAAVPFDALMRGAAAGFSGGQEFVNQALGGGPLGRDIAAIPEAFQGSPHTLPQMRAPGEALRLVPSGPEAALAEGLQGEALRPAAADAAVADDAAARALLSPSGRPTPTERVRVPVEQPADAPVEAPAVAAEAPAAPTGPDIHAIARQIAPKVFDEYDTLAARKETFRGWIDDLAAQRDAGTSPEIAKLDEQITTLREKRLAASGQDRRDIANQVTALEDRRSALADALPKEGDTPEMARVRRDMQETDYRMRDLAPDVSTAYRRAAEEGSPENPSQTSIGEGVPDIAATPPDIAAPPPEAPKTGEMPEAAPAAIPPSEPVPEAAAAPTPPATRPASPPIEGGIAGDVAKQLTAAGRPSEEAAAVGAVAEARYTARSANLRGTTPEELYREDGARIVRARQRVPEMAQSRELGQGGATIDIGGHELPLNADGTVTLYHATKTATQADRIIAEKTLRSAGEPSVYLSTAKEGTGYGDHVVAVKIDPKSLRIDDEFPDGRADFAIDRKVIRVSDASRPIELEQARRGSYRPTDPETGARATIKVFREADASTAIHELGHDYLEQMIRDAIDPRATDQLRADTKAIRDYLGLPDDATLRERDAKDNLVYRKQHEKFARSFERYMMEGHAPSAGLARVFQQFKQWLTDIYQTVAKLRAPISDDIRAVFDRMLATPDEKPIIAPEAGPAKAFADIHEADIDATPPEHAIAVADTLQAERDRIAAETAPEINSGRPDRRAGSEARGAEPGNSALDRGGDAGQPDPGAAGNGAQPGAVSAGGNEAAPQRDGVAARAGAATTAPAGPNAGFERAPEAGVTDKAGNIRLELLNTPEDVNTVLRQAAAENNEFLTERRGVIPDAEVERLADALGMDPAKLNRRKIGQAFSAEEIVAARKLLIQSATQVRDAMRKAATGSDADVLAYAKAKAQHLMIQGQVSGVTAEAGRALRAFREINMMEGAQDAKDLGQFLLKSATGRDLFQLREEAQFGLSLKTPRELSQFVRDTWDPRLTDKVFEVWMNALLSNPLTHQANLIGNGLTALYSVPETAAAAAVGRARQLLPGADAARVEVGEAGARLFGIARGATEGVHAGWELLKNEDLTEMHTKTEAGRRFQAIGGTTGKVVRLPGRLLGAEDKVFKGIAYRQEINARAYRQASQEGLSGDRFSARMAQIVNDPPVEMIEAATKYADYQTYNNALGNVGNAAMHLANSHPAIRFIVPFIRTPLNILKYAAERTPFGLLMEDVRDNLAGKNGAIARDTQIARTGLGTAVGVTAAYFAAQGLITGGGPSDPKAKAALRLTGWQPYSIKVGDGYYSFSRLDPFSTILGVAADMYEVTHYATESERESVAKLIFGSISKNLVSKTWLKGPSDFIQAITDPDRYGQIYIKGFAGTVIPAGVAQVARWSDPYMRDAHSVIDGIKARIPGVSTTMYPRRDAWGEPIPQDGSFLPIAHSRVSNDPTNQALERLGYAPGNIERKIENVPLSGEQYDELSRLAGRMAKVRVDALVQYPGFAAWPDGVKREAVAKAISEQHKAARAAIMLKYPDLKEKIIEAKKDKLAGTKR